jgi:hypothetical protein
VGLSFWSLFEGRDTDWMEIVFRNNYNNDVCVSFWVEYIYKDGDFVFLHYQGFRPSLLRED